MPNYRRAWHAGGTYFFTVNLLQRHGNDLLTRHVDLLRAVVRSVRQRPPFHIHGWVVLPEHLHCVMELPLDDVNFATRWRLIKFRRVGSLLPTRSTRAAQSTWATSCPPYLAAMRRNALRLLRPTAAIKTAADNPRAVARALQFFGQGGAVWRGSESRPRACASSRNSTKRLTLCMTA